MTPNALMNWTKVEIKQRISGYDTWNKITCEASAADLVNQKKKQVTLGAQSLSLPADFNWQKQDLALQWCGDHNP